MPTSISAADDGKKPVTTYVLIGNRMDNEEAAYRAKADYTIIKAKPGASLESQLKQIKTPANIILQAHGSVTGQFEWSAESDYKPYGTLFKSLPSEGIGTILVTSCYGERAQTQIAEAPAGSLVVTTTSSSNLSIFQNQMVLKEGAGVTSAVDLYLETLDNFFPDYKKAIKYLNHEQSRHDNANPENAIPVFIGVGGKNGQLINLEEKCWEQLVYHPKQIDQQAMARAVARVQDHFDTQNYRFDKETGTESLKQGDAKDEAKLDDQIAKVAKNITKGRGPATFDERRMALAITAAYMEETGELAQAVRAAGGILHPDIVKDPKYDAAGNYMDVSTMQQHSTTKHITDEEQLYIGTAVSLLKQNGMVQKEVDAISKQLKAAFVKSDGNDVLDAALTQTLQKAHISTKGWEK